MKTNSCLRLIFAGVMLMFLSSSLYAQQYPYKSNGSSGARTVSAAQVVNTYAAVTAISGNRISYTGAVTFTRGDKVLIIDMKGTGAGNWQFDTVQVTGNPVTVSSIHTAFYAGSDVVQIVKVPQYTNLKITPAGKLTATPWNGSVGGILSFMVRDTFTIDSGGRCDVSMMGFTGGAGGVAGAAGGGGGGGAAGFPAGVHGGASGLVVNSGIGGGGDGGQYGGAPGTNVSAPALNCPGCGYGAVNRSKLDTTLIQVKMLMGAAGSGGNGGPGGTGGGGGGGGAGAAGVAQSGTAGASGGSGGAGGTGGSGGGLIVFTANYMNIDARDTPFISIGKNATDGTSATNGGNGGNGGMGGGPTCLLGGGGGGGGGAYGGYGGNGGSGGSGGTIFPILFHASINLRTRSYNVSGGLAGGGGAGGSGGHAGANAGIIGGFPCVIAGTGGGSGPGYNPPPVRDGDSCTLVVTMRMLDTIHHRANGTSDTFHNMKIYGSGPDTVWAQPIDSFSVLVYTVKGGQVYYTMLVDTRHRHSPMITVDRLFTTGAVTYDTTLIGSVYGPDTLQSTCPYLGRNSASDGGGGTSGSDGSDGGSGGSAGSAVILPDCQTYAIYASNTSQFIGDGCAGSLDPLAGGTVSGGRGAYTYMVSDPVINCDYYTGYTETYLVQVSDTANCTTDFNAVLYTSYNNYSLNVTGVTDASCPTAYDGGVIFDLYKTSTQACVDDWSITIINSTNNYSTSLTGNGDSYQNMLYGLPAGTYDYDITAGSNCNTLVGSGFFFINSLTTPVDGHEYITICDGDVFFWPFSGGYYSQTGTYSYTVYGFGQTCDTTSYLDLLVLDPITAGNFPSQTAGDNCGYVFDPVSLAVTGGDGNYNYTVTQGQTICQNGGSNTQYDVLVTDGHSCVAQLQADVTLLQDDYDAQVVLTTDASCDNVSDGYVDFNIVNLTNQECVSSYTLNIYPPYPYPTITRTGNTSGPYQENGLPSGTYSYDIMGGGTCSAMYSGTFTIGYANTAPPDTHEYDTICSGGSILWHGQAYTQAGDYNYIIAHTAGQPCNISAYLHLYVAAPPASGVVYDTIAAGQSVSIGSHVHTAAGIYTDTIPSVFGCDSMITLYLEVLSGTVYSTRTDTVCYGGFIVVGNSIYNSDGIYTDTIITAGGYDSIVTSYLTVRPATTDYISASSCQGSVYTYGGQNYTTDGAYTLHLQSQYGCDSMVVLTLTFTPPVPVNINATICQGQSYWVGGSTYHATGLYNTTLVSLSGCDSLVILNLTVSPPLTGDVYDTICQGGAYVFGGAILNAAGTYTNTVQSALGCDSVITLHLSVADPLPQTLIDTICQGESYAFGTNTYTAAGTYTNTVYGNHGSCDTLQTLYLTVLPDVTPSLVITVTHGANNAGIQTDTFRASYTGCDGAYYSWYLNLQPVGQHDSLAIISHLLAQGDSIICRIDCNNRCASTTYTYSNRILSGLSSPDPVISAIGIYPDPNRGTFTLEISSTATREAQVAITDMIGQTVMTSQMPLRSGDNKNKITLDENIVSGIYIAQVTVDGHTLYQRISVER